MEVIKGKRYINNKTGRMYEVLCTAYAAWDAGQVLVVYRGNDEHDGAVWVRSLTEFKIKFKEPR